jgi:hypothetical protein
MKTVINAKSVGNEKLGEDVRNAREETERARNKQPERYEAPSLGHKHNTNGEPRQVFPPDGGRRKLFSEALRGEKCKSHRITVQSKDIDQSMEQLKLQLKKDIDPTNIKV